MPSSYRNYAVDFNSNRTIDLLRENVDSIGSVANYLQGYGGIRGEPVATRAQIGAELPASAAGTPRTLAEWAATGIVPGVNFASDTHRAQEPLRGKPARLIDFTVEESKEYWLAFNNFEVIMRYNNSDFYAMSVFQLAEELKAARKAGKP